MMSKADWHQAIDDLMATVNAAGYGAALHKAIAEYHEKPYNKKLNFGLICGGCSASIYFAVDRLYHSHFLKSASPPPVKCPKCKHEDDHGYQGLAS